MAAPANFTDAGICSTALGYIGEDTIVSLDDDSARARKCKQFFPSVLKAVLRSHNWNCVVKRLALQKDAIAPVYDFEFRFLLPPDYNFLIETSLDPQVPYRIEGRYILSHESGLSITYVAEDTDPSKFDALLADALARRLAMDLAIPLTGTVTIRDKMEASYKEVLQDAKTRDGQEDFPKVIYANDLINVRLE